MRLLACSPALLALLGPTTALAGDATAMPPMFRGDVEVAYGGSFEEAGIEEGDQVYAIRRDLRHDVLLRGEVGLYKGISFQLALPIGASRRISWGGAREMLLDPGSNEGTYVDGPILDPTPELKASGVYGLWLGVGLAPFREDYDRGLPVSMRFDLAFRTPAKGDTIYGDRRGVSPGGSGLKLAGAFSKKIGAAEPFATVAYTHDFGAKVEVTDLDDQSVGTVRVAGGARVDVEAGAEFLARDDEASGSRVAIDLHVGFAYQGPSDRASGFFLPSTLPLSDGIPVTRGEHLRLGGGLALRYDVNRFVGIHAGADGAWITPHRVEHVYAASTDTATWDIRWTLGITGRVRLKGDRK